MPSGTGYGKWYLPPVGANGLGSMYANNTKILSHTTGTVSADAAPYWSSTVWSWNGTYNYWYYVRLNDSGSTYDANFYDHRVRCVAK